MDSAIWITDGWRTNDICCNKFKKERRTSMGIACDVVTCKNNIGEFCNKVDIYISEAETGEPLCQDVEFENEEN